MEILPEGRNAVLGVQESGRFPKTWYCRDVEAWYIHTEQK